jgi:hypothetical protein
MAVELGLKRVNEAVTGSLHKEADGPRVGDLIADISILFRSGFRIALTTREWSMHCF